MNFVLLYLHIIQQIKVKVSQITHQRVFGRPPSSTDYIFFAFLSQCVGRSTRAAAIFLIITLQAVTEPTGLVNLWDSHSSTISSTCFSLQGDFYSTALKTLISVSTLVLLGLVIAYHSLEVQVITYSYILTNFTHAIELEPHVQPGLTLCTNEEMLPKFHLPLCIAIPPLSSST